MSDEDRARLRVIAEKLKGKELFPQTVARKTAIFNALIPLKERPSETIFTEDTQLFRDEVKIISEKIADFLAQERKLFDSKVKNKKNDDPK